MSGDLDTMDAVMALLDRHGPPAGEYGISLTWCPWPIPEQPTLSRRELLDTHLAGPTGGYLTDPNAIAKRRAAQKAQRAARRRNRP